MKYKSKRTSIPSIGLDAKIHLDLIATRNFNQILLAHEMELLENFPSNALYDDLFSLRDEVRNTPQDSHHKLIETWSELISNMATPLYLEPYLQSVLFFQLADNAYKDDQHDRAWSYLCYSQELYFDVCRGAAIHSEELKQSSISRKKANKGHALLRPTQEKVASLLITMKPITGWNGRTEAVRKILPSLMESLNKRASDSDKKALSLVDLEQTIINWTRNANIVKEAWEISRKEK